MKDGKTLKRVRSGRAAGKGGELRNRVAFPNTKQENLAAIGIFEDVVNAIEAGDFKEAGAARIGAHVRADAQEDAQFGEFLQRMVSQVFQNGRLFLHIH
jgi:hypothetical protein